ncbi:hypothetical protein C8R43DRAFT_1122165 [Mycena crocata]|nr:hypothetical protein C8R43DRAFT_1122165 [Mycena crocata]
MSHKHPPTPTNLTREEMVPDNVNPAHDSRYWCLPPRRDRDALPQEGGRYPMYLVTQGRMCGIWRSWLVTKSMVDGYPAGAQRGHRSVAACIDEWQLGCRLGLHPHPADPAFATSSQSTSAPTSTSSPLATPPRSPSPVSSAPSSPSSLARASELPTAVESSSASSSTLSSITVSSPPDPVADKVQYYAIWAGRIVYSDRLEAKRAFLATKAAGKSLQLLTSDNYDEAQAFSEGVHWVAD